MRYKYCTNNHHVKLMSQTMKLQENNETHLRQKSELVWFYAKKINNGAIYNLGGWLRDFRERKGDINVGFLDPEETKGVISRL